MLMFGKPTLIRVAACSLLLCAMATARSAEDNPPAEQWVSPDALIVVRIERPAQLLDHLFDPRVVQAVTATPQYQEQSAKSEFQQAMNLVQYFESKYQADARELLGKLLGGGITWALGPDETSVLIVDAQDEQMLSEVHEFFLMIARNEAEKQGQPGRVKSAEYRGLTGWSFGPKETHAVVGNRLVLSNKPEALKLAVDLRAEPGGSSLATSDAYQAACRAAGPAALAFAYVNTGVLKHLPDIDKALRQYENPLAAMLLAPLATGLRDSSWMSVSVQYQDDRLTWNLVSDGGAGDPEAPDGFASPAAPEDGAYPCPTVPNQIAGFSLYRDLHHFYGAKDELFPERTSGLIFFENMMGIFFTGRDLTEEVLAEVAPDIRVVVAEQQYAGESGTPRIQIPSFAAVLRMRDAEKFARVMEEAFQKALGLINFTRGQNAQPGLIIDRPTHQDTKYTMAYFSPPAPGEPADGDVRFNFQPTLAMPGDYLILSSTESLARDLIDSLQAEAAGGVQPVAGLHTALRLDGPQLASLLDANRESLVQKNMVEEGHTREEAEKQIDLFLKIAGAVRELKLDVGSRDDESRATLEISIHWP
jgi:hypothetical protein